MTNILVLQVFEKLQLSVGALGQDRSAKGLHDLLDGDILVGELVAGRAGSRAQRQGQRIGPEGTMEGSGSYQTRPKAPMPTGCRSEYLEVISKVVPKICARTNSAMVEELLKQVENAFCEVLRIYVVQTEVGEVSGPGLRFLPDRCPIRQMRPCGWFKNVGSKTGPMVATCENGANADATQRVKTGFGWGTGPKLINLQPGTYTWIKALRRRR